MERDTFKTSTDSDVAEKGISGSSAAQPEALPDASVENHAHGSPLERYINLVAVVNFGVIILCSWEAFATTFQFALLNGGPASIFYGSWFASIGACCIGFSLAELASIDPTVGAQYRWSANLAPFAPRFWGLLQGWITVAAWCFSCTGPPSILANMITSMAIFNNPDYVPKRWHTSLIMIGCMAIPFLFNLWFRKVLSAFEMVGGVLHIVLFVVVIVVLIVMGKRNDSTFVFETLTWQDSGWNNKGISWGLGLLSMAFSVVGADSVLHMCDEVKKVRTRVPRSIILTCTVNTGLLIIFATILLFYMGPVQEVASTPLPILWIFYNITGSRTAANLLTSLIALILFFAVFNIFASVSRLVWVFARDNGLPFSSFFAYVHPGTKLPLNALFLVGFVGVCISLIYIASATAFNAIIALQALALHISYIFPFFFMLLRRIRGPPPPYGPFSLGKFGIPVNIAALTYVIFVVIWMPFPQILPVTADNMNYSGPIFIAVVIGALAHWFIRGRKTFRMPLIKYE